MAEFRNYQSRAIGAGAQADASIDQGLRAYMIRVYNLMGLGLLITGLAAWGAFQMAVTGDGQLTAFGQLIYTSAFRWVVILAPLAAVFFLSFRIQSMSVAAAQTTFWVYAGLVGLSLSTIMGVFGLIIAMVVNIFLQSSAMAFAISAIGVLVFAGLTAYDTQKIKEMYYEGDDDAVAGRKAIMGALSLYLDFINLFVFMLQFMGDRR